MKSNMTRILTITLLSMVIVAICVTGCKKEEPPATPEPAVTDNNIDTPPPPPAVEPDKPPVDEPVTEEPATPETAIKEKKYIYRIFEDEDNPDTYVDLVQFATFCKEPIGDIFGSGYITVNPTLEDEIKVPIDRVVSIEFNKRGLIERDIDGVGKINQPVGYRDSKVVLRNPDEEIGDIVVICRRLGGIKVDGSNWSLNLINDASKKFYKIELLDAGSVSGGEENSDSGEEDTQ